MQPRINLALFILCGLLLAHIGYAQQPLPAFKPLRYNEDYSYLAKDTARTSYENMKFIPLGKDQHQYLSIGGEARLQYFHAKNEEWGDVPADNDGYILSRFLLHGDFHFGSRFRTFVQLQSSLSGSRIEPSPVDENPLDLHQAFVDVVALDQEETQLTLRLGRQEMSYGSQRLVSVRENPNNRQSFDGVKVMLNRNNTSIDAFYSHYVAVKKQIMDDGFNKNTRFWGVYGTQTNLPVLGNMDLYYLGFSKKKAVYNALKGDEERHSIGSRIWGGYGSWTYDLEGLYQFGQLDALDIQAWTASLNTTYQFVDARFQPELGLKTELISGDKGTGKTLGTFNPMFPKGAYFGLAAVIGPSNLVDLHPSVNFSLSKKLDLTLDYDIFWRMEEQDGIYAVNMSPIYGDGNTNEMHIGNQLTSALLFSPNRFVNIRGEWTWFQAGDYLKAVSSAKDFFFSGLTLQLKI
ncbi:alginate export family protein [Sphingobacterium lactis]|uniref:alginate export family protein n=1 Tax=Sphingobacterium lactis TaxID=797291 RepID=UPI003DA353D0